MVVTHGASGGKAQLPRMLDRVVNKLLHGHKWAVCPDRYNPNVENMVDYGGEAL